MGSPFLKIDGGFDECLVISVLLVGTQKYPQKSL